MKNKKAFTLIELLVVIAIIAMLMAILMPTLGKAKDLARAVVCKSNVKQCVTVCFLYTVDYDDYFQPFWDAVDNAGNKLSDSKGQEAVMWQYCAEDYYQNADMLLCASAKKYNESISGTATTPGTLGGGIGTFKSPWQTYWGRDLISTGEPATSSYTFNDYLGRLVGSHRSTTRYQERHFQKTSAVKDASIVPVMMDGVWYHTAPNLSDPVQYAAKDPREADWINRVSHFTHLYDSVLMPRHSGGNSVAFMDGSARRGSMKDLWRYKWHKKWDTKNDYTKPTYNNWPEWIDKLRD